MSASSASQSASSDATSSSASARSGSSSSGGGSSSESDGNSMRARFRAAMVLSAVGDALGYRNGSWEFDKSGPHIHEELEKMGGLDAINLKKWKVSDDTVMHLATADALIEGSSDESAGQPLFERLAAQYVACAGDMEGRAPGPWTLNSIALMKRNGWDAVRYGKAGGGCGGSMRAMCIGLRYHGAERRADLIAASIESGRLTHNHPTGFFGALASALFTAYAIEGVPVIQWGRRLIDEVMPEAYTYIRKDKVRTNEWKDYQEGLKYFENAFESYLTLRGIRKKGAKKVKWPKKYGVKERDAFYNSISFSGWGGASGHDSVIIAYDALLGAGDSWEDFCLRGILHGGDNDSTGAIGGAWFGALYGRKDVPANQYTKVEYAARAVACADALLALS